MISIAYIIVHVIIPVQKLSAGHILNKILWSTIFLAVFSNILFYTVHFVETKTNCVKNLESNDFLKNFSVI